MIAKGISYVIVTILLSIIYLILIIPYSLFMRQNKQPWIFRNVSSRNTSYNNPW